MPVSLDLIKETCELQISKYRGDWTSEEILAKKSPAPYEVLSFEHNLLTYSGASIALEALIGNAVTPFSAAHAHIGVGNSSAAAHPTQTDLQGESKLRKGMDVGFPLHAPGNNPTASTVQFAATFGAGEASWEWLEFCLANAASGGTMFNRKVINAGVKGPSETWRIVITIGFA